jgi:hypothetical protein
MHPLFALVSAKLAQLDAAHAARAAEVAEAEEAARGRTTPLAAAPAARLRAGAVAAFYTAIEDLLRTILEEVDGSVPSGSDWHRNLLLQASAELPGRRPALIDAALLRELDALRALRHRVQHDYGLTPDAALLVANWGRLGQVRDALGAAIDTLRATIDPPGEAGP